MPTVTQSVYDTDYISTIHTNYGMIKIIHDISLGDMIIVTVLSMIVTFNVIKYIIDRLWG